MYSILVSIFISFFLISCGNDHDSSVSPVPVKKFYPLAVKRIAYETSEESCLSGNTLVHLLKDTNSTSGRTLKVEKISPDEETKTIAFIDAPKYTDAIALKDNILIAIYEEYDSASDDFLPNIMTYKIEDNNTITQLGTTPIDTEIDGNLPWDVEVAHVVFKENILAISLSSFYDTNELYSVMLYKQDENNSFHYLQTLTSDNNETDATLFGYNSIDVSKNFIAVSERCSANIFTQDENSSLFSKTDVYTFENDTNCRLLFHMSNNHLFIDNSRVRQETKYRLLSLNDSGKIANTDDLSYVNRGPSLVIEDAAFIPNNNGFEMYTIRDTKDSLNLVKSRDITLGYYPRTILDGGSTFLSGNDHYLLSMDFFETYPQDRLYILSDTNSALYLDEGNVYPFYKITASSMHEPISYSLSGDDSEYFEIIDNAIVPKAALNYKDPVDMDANNIYEITLNISDTQGNRKNIDFHVYLQEKDYVTKAVTYSDDNSTRGLWFGNPLYLDNESLVVASRTNIYLFKVDDNNFTQLAKSEPDSRHLSTNAVAKVNNTLLAGSSYYKVNDSLSSAGGVSVYRYEDANSTLNFKNMLISPEPTADGLFGSTIFVDNNTTLISQPGQYQSNYMSTGKVYIYDTNDSNFTLKQTLQAPDAQIANNFGKSMGMDGRYLIVGAPGSNSWSGAAYLYKKDENGSMVYLETLLPSGNAIDFGDTVLLSGSYLGISAYSSVNQTNNLYIYQINPDNDHVYLVAMLNNVLSNRSDALALENNNLFIAESAKIKGYDRMQDIIKHYQIAEDGSVNLKETLINHLSDNMMVTRPFYSIVSDGDSIVVGNAMANLGDIIYHGSLTLYKKNQE